MNQLSGSKKASILRMFFHGFSYDEIAVKTNTSKGTVANVVSALKAGQFAEAANLGEHIDFLRELAIDLKEAKLTPVQAIAGLAVLSALSQVDIEPSELDTFRSVIKTYAAPGADVPALIKAALALDEVQKSTGLTAPELETKVLSLKKEAAQLEPLAGEVKSRQKQLAQLQDNLKKAVAEVAHREKHLGQLKQTIKESKAAETQLAAHTAELEERAFQANKQLTQARQDLKKLADTGLSFDDLAVFTQQVKEVASHHQIKPALVRDRLTAELKLLDKVLGLETLVKAKTEQLAQIKESISQLEAKRAALASSADNLLAQRDVLQADVAAARQNLKNDIAAIGKAAQAAREELIAGLKSGIEEGLAEVNKMRDGALEVGQQMGELKETISSHDWLRDLVSLVKGEALADGNRVRVIALTLLRPLSGWLSASEKGAPGTYFLRMALDNALKGVEEWKPQAVLPSK